MTEHPIGPSHGDPLVTVRMDTMGRILCSAHGRTGELCNGPAVRGLTVCRLHGAGSPASRQAARLRLLDLDWPAVQALADLLASDNEMVRLKAANSILDRVGYARATRVEAGDARAFVMARVVELLEARGGRGDVH